MPPKGSKMMKRPAAAAVMRKPAAALRTDDERASSAAEDQKAVMRKPAAARRTDDERAFSAAEDQKEPASPAAASPAPSATGSVAAPEAPCVSTEYVRGQRMYTAWVPIPGTMRRVLGPPRDSHDRATSDIPVLREMADKPWAGEAVAGRWRKGELDDKQAVKEMREAPAEGSKGKRSREEGEDGGAPVLKRPAAAKAKALLKRPAMAGGSEPEEGEDGGVPVLKRPAAAKAKGGKKEEEEEGEKAMANWGGA